MSFTEPRLCFFVRMVFFNEGTDLIQDNSLFFDKMGRTISNVSHRCINKEQKK